MMLSTHSYSRPGKVRYFIFSFLMLNSYHLWCWPWSAEDPRRNYTCRMNNLGGTFPDDVCVLCEYLKKVARGEKEEHPMVNSWIYYGKEGTGKTKTAEDVARQSNCTVDIHTAEELSEKIKITGSSAGVVTDLFENALKKKRSDKPVVLIVNDIETLLRNNPEHSEMILSSFRTLMDEYRNDRYFQIIFTGRRTPLDEGFSGRCASVKFQLPNAENRKEILQHHLNLKKFPHQLSERELNFLVWSTKKFSGGDIEKLVDTSTALAHNQRKFPLLRGYCTTLLHSSQLKENLFYPSLIISAIAAALVYFGSKYVHTPKTDNERPQ